MLDRQGLAREIGIPGRAHLMLLGLCLFTAGPAAAQTASVPTSQDPQSTTAQGASQRTSSSTPQALPLLRRLRRPPPRHRQQPLMPTPVGRRPRP
jgi:hypothetical protein